MIPNIKFPPSYIEHTSIIFMSDNIVCVYPFKLFRICRIKRFNRQFGAITLPWFLGICKMQLLHFWTHEHFCLCVSEVFIIFQKPLLILVKIIRFPQIDLFFVFLSTSGLKGKMGSMDTSYHIWTLTGLLLVLLMTLRGLVTFKTHDYKFIFKNKNNIVIFYWIIFLI